MQDQPAAVHLPKVEFEEGDFPHFFVDYVASLYYYPGFVKLNFADLNLDVFGRSDEPAVATIQAQLIITNLGFANMVAFLDHKLNEMVQAGAISADAVQTAHQQVAQQFSTVQENATTTKTS